MKETDKKIDDSPSAFPLPGIPGVMQETRGMTLRDYFAGQAIRALVSKNGTHYTAGNQARTSYEFADEMIKERAK